MAAAERRDSWLELQRMREERMRFEILRMLYEAAGGRANGEVHCWGLAQQLGVWHAEVFRVVEFLERHGFLVYLRAGPVVRLTQAGIDYVESGAGQRHSIRGPAPGDEPE